MPMTIPWDRFSGDPRSSDHATLRASDADRDVALDVLGAAFAEGRVDQGEYDERMTTLTSARTLGDLLPPLRDLVPDQAAVVPSTPDELQGKAEDRYKQVRAQAIATFFGPSLICWIIWIATSFGPGGFQPYFPWPIFVSLGTIARTAQVITTKREIIAKERAKLEREERRAIERKPN